MNSKYISLVDRYSGNSDVFFRFLNQSASNLGIRAEWLADIIYLESGFNPNAKNPNGSASGLIQFIESTAKELGTTTAAIRQMTNVQQLPYVEKYFSNWFSRLGKPKDGFELYVLVFYPAWFNKPDESRLPDNAYKANRSIDADGKGFITKGDFRKWYGKRLGKAVATTTTQAIKNIGTFVFIAAALAAYKLIRH
ncbi:transglycosylase SLT domain-containing protein [Parapedobacter sp. 2B3]|uniref:transglycosylase SLT domain-containing protein n=1 Tax=Parapedobacter sp. 2B3 TaxID=3342381 RepID=UPI0035B68E07